jgi:hypothetical protein
MENYSIFYRLVGGVWVPQNFNTTLEYTPATFPIWPGDELRAIFRIDWVDEDPSVAPHFFDDASPDQLTGLVYDLVVTGAIIPAPGGTITLFLGAGGRYAPTIAGDGGKLDIWEDSIPDWGTAAGIAPQAGPGAWILGGDPVVNPGPPIPHDDYPGATNTVGGAVDPGAGGMNALQFLAMEWVPLPLSPAGTLFRIDLPTFPGPTGGFLLTGSGLGQGFTSIIGGTYGLIQPGGFGIASNGAPMDVSVRETLTFPPDPKFPVWPDPLLYGWSVNSEDPLRFVNIPEPATMSLLLLGLVGGAGAYLRRRRAA